MDAFGIATRSWETPLRPTVRQLEYLVQLADRLNFRAAADACFVSQPALSKQIQALEASLGVTLFERDRTGVLPTQAGRELSTEAREILRAIDRLVERASALREPLSGTLRLGSIPTVAPFLLPLALDAIQERHPNLRLFLREDPTHRLVEQLAEGDLDLLLLAIDADLGDLDTEFLFTDDFLFAAPKGHPLAESDDPIALSALRDQDVLLLTEEHCLRSQVLPLCNDAGAAECGDFRASSLPTLVQMVQRGIGVTLVPELARPAIEQSAPNLRLRPIEQNPGRQIGLAFRAHSPRADEFRALGEAIAQAYGQDDADARA